MDDNKLTQPNRSIQGWTDVPGLKTVRTTNPFDPDDEIIEGIKDKKIDLGSGSRIVSLNAEQELKNKIIDLASNIFRNTDLVLQWLPVGTPLMRLQSTLPDGYLWMDGSAISRDTYRDLFGVLVPRVGTATMTIASPCVVTLNSHGLLAGDAFYFTTTGTLPTGVSANTIYYVISAGLTTDSFRFATTRGGSAINSSASQSGVHTVMSCPWGLGNGTTTFNLPDFRKKVPAGVDNTQSEFSSLGQSGGEIAHTLTIGEAPAHTHTGTTSSKTYGSTSEYGFGSGSNDMFGTINGSFVQGGMDHNHTFTTDSSGGGGAHNNLQPYVSVKWIIKY